MKFLSKLLDNKTNETNELIEIITWLEKLLKICEVDSIELKKFLEDNPIPDERITFDPF